MKLLNNSIIAFVTTCLLSLPALAQDDQPVHRKKIMVGAQGAKSGAAPYGGFVDLQKGKVYTLDEATDIQEQIDMLYGYGKNTKSNVISVSSRQRDYFGKTYRESLHKWTELNRGTFIALPDTKENQKTFKKIKTVGELKEAYETGLKVVKDRADYKLTSHGPSSNRLRRLKENELIYFKSRYREGLYAAFKVIEVKEGYRGYIKLDLITVGE
ncbi:hypothetical protein [Sinomicrobium sp.]